MRKVHNAVAWTALFFSLGGTAIAASHYLINSTSQIKPNVRRALHGARGPEGFAGPQGPGGPQGSAGAAGAAGILGLVVVNGAERTFAPGEYGAPPTAECPSGSTVVGTGFNGPFNVVGGFVLKFGTFVGGFFENESSITIKGYVQAICAQLPPGATIASVGSLHRRNVDAFRGAVARAERQARGARR